MNNEMRLVKFETLIKDINEATNRGGGFLGIVMSMTSLIGQTLKNRSMMLIYDYDGLNDYGKIILENSSIRLSDWENKYPVESLKDSKARIEAAKEFIRLCRMDENRKEAYKFIFWALMVLTVDKTDKEERLSLICDFARMLKISDDEMMDIVLVIKVLYHEEDEGFTFKTDTVPEYFSSALFLYN